MSEFVRPRSMADLVVEQATAAPGEVREVPITRVSGSTVDVVCPCCNASVRVELKPMTVVDL